MAGLSLAYVWEMIWDQLIIGNLFGSMPIAGIAIFGLMVYVGLSKRMSLDVMVAFGVPLVIVFVTYNYWSEMFKPLVMIVVALLSGVAWLKIIKR